MKKTTFGLFAALVSTIFISSYSTFSKILLEHFSTYSLAAIAQIFSVITLMLFFGAWSELKDLGKLKRKEMIALIFVGILSAVIQPLFLFNGLLKTSAINGVLISRTQMVIVGIISAIWLKERVGVKQIWGTIIMFGGAYFIATKGLTEQINIAGGDILLLGAAFFGALSTNVFKRYLTNISPQLTVFFRNLTGAILNLTLVPFVFGFEHNFSKVFDFNTFLIVCAFTLLAIVGAQYLWYKAVEMIPATEASTMGMSSPLFGVLIAMFVLQETLYLHHMVGGLLIVIGLILATLHNQKHPEHHKHLKAKQWVH
ncbi:DMT family transporter [Candidatus Peregrinibacteria bacterium]|nr:DMT family transporter [Candidatus Peregrinibacteria bacterium]